MDLHDEGSSPALSASLERVLESAAQLQRLVPDAVLVGGSVAAMYAGHRLSFDHDHVLADLAERFDVVLEALESDGDWVLNRAVPGKILLGQLGEIETGLRQLIRTRPLETARVVLPSGAHIAVPTPDEILRIKGYLIVKRNQVRDFLDVAALSARYGTAHAGRVLAAIDDYYDATVANPHRVASQLVRQLSAPQPADEQVTRELANYKGLIPRWTQWSAVTDQCADVADAVLAELGGVP